VTALRRVDGASVELPETEQARALARQVAEQHLHALLLEELADAMPGASNDRVVATAHRVHAAILRDLSVAFPVPVDSG
jgi:hypothetical protein